MKGVASAQVQKKVFEDATAVMDCRRTAVFGHPCPLSCLHTAVDGFYCHVWSLVPKVGRSGGRTTHEPLLGRTSPVLPRSIAWCDGSSASSGQLMGTRQPLQGGRMAVSTWSACMERVGTVIRRHRGAENQALSQPAGAFQSRVTHNIVREVGTNLTLPSE
jgi:hypothetical protein